ncbi:hypothetical protein Bbelb_250460 [Branchiostoma belcheri]|nr:hypothetical protein Bbelb_250460 [Branchiostoma belcheri]
MASRNKKQLEVQVESSPCFTHTSPLYGHGSPRTRAAPATHRLSLYRRQQTPWLPEWRSRLLRTTGRRPPRSPIGVSRDLPVMHIVTVTRCDVNQQGGCHVTTDNC